MEGLSHYLDLLNQLIMLLWAIGQHWEYIDHLQQQQDQNACQAPLVSTAIGISQ